MKKSFCLLILFVSSVASATQPTPTPSKAPAKTPAVPPQFCQVLDKSNDFVRCETTEVICYSLKSNLACWPKATPKPVPSPAK
jgi:hypothetical protein